MSQFGDTVTVVNRTKKTMLEATWNGTHYQFKPGETAGVPPEIAVAAYKQNPILGTEDPLGDPEVFRSLIGIKGAKDPFGDCSQAEQSTAGERIDRKKVMGLGRDVTSMDAGAPTYFDSKIGADAGNSLLRSSEADTKT